MSHKKPSIIPGALLIFVGLILLLKRLDVVDIYWENTYPLILIGLGVAFFISVFARDDRNASFWSTTFLLLGFFFFLRNYNLIPFYFWDEIWPVILLAIGISFVVLYLFKPQDWGVLIPGVVLLFIGFVALAHTMDFYWRTSRFIEDFWPVILILIGGALVLSSFLRKKSIEE